MSFCHHQEILTREGVVCSLCGVVLDQLYETPLLSQPSRPLYPDLYDICVRMHTSLYPQIETCFSELLKLGKPRNYMMGAAIYSTLNRFGCSQDIELICYLCNISSKRLWKYMSEVPVDHTFHYDFAENYLQILKLPYRIICEIKRRADLIEGSYNPRTVCAAMAYNYLKTTPQKMSLNKLTKQLGVSQMSVYRCLKSIRQNASLSPWQVHSG